MQAILIINNWLLGPGRGCRVLAIILSIFVTGCSHKAAPVTANSSMQWTWDAYPPVEKMRLATLPCQVQPRTSLTIHAPVSGQLRLYIDRPQTNLPAGFVWAEFEPKALTMEGAELAEARKRIEERERLFAEI